jgi:hypothetical protein
VGPTHYKTQPEERVDVYTTLRNVKRIQPMDGPVQWSPCSKQTLRQITDCNNIAVICSLRFTCV